MTLNLVCLLALFVPEGQDGQGRLVLPPKPPPQPARAAAAAEPLPEKERFLRALFRLRRSASLSTASRDLVLQEIAADFVQPADKALAASPKANEDLMHAVLEVVRRYGTPEHAKELQYLLLTRPFGEVSRNAVATMVELAPAEAKDLLLSCLSGRYAGVRKAAADLLLPRLDTGDAPRLLELSRSGDADVRGRALLLLGAVPTPATRERLIAALSEGDPAVAAIACESLVDHGLDVAPTLQSILASPPRDHSYGYSAYALSVLEDQTGQVLLADQMLPHLRAELDGDDLFLRASCALALANLAFRSDDTSGVKYGDAKIVESLMLVVAPRGFVAHLAMLQKPAAQKIVHLTGLDFGGRSQAWRSWWEGAKAGFVGARLAIPIHPENAADALLVWSDERGVVRFHGEQAVPATGNTAEGVLVDDYRLAGADLAALVEALRAHGFMTAGLVAAAASSEPLPVARTLELRLGSARALVRGPVSPAAWLDALAAEVETVLRRERWQLYRAPGVDPLTDWRSQREALAQQPDPRQRARSFLTRWLAAYGSLPPRARPRAVAHLFDLEGLRELLTEADGLALVEHVAKAEILDEDTLRLAEIALQAPGDSVQSRVLEIADVRSAQGGAGVLPRVFAMLGADRVLQAVDDARPGVRTAAILEIAALKDARAIPALLAALTQTTGAVREAAIYALGVLHAVPAREPLFALLEAPDLDVITRRAVWVALGRIGGKGVLPLLQTAVAAADPTDQLAAVQALGELQDPEAAQFLAQVFVAQSPNPLGTQAMASLRKLGAVLARPALRQHLRTREPDVRRDLVLALAEMQDPAVVPELMVMLDEEHDSARLTFLLSGITGLNLLGENDRRVVLKDWWRTHKDLPQAAWFLEAVQRGKLNTTLRLEQLTPGAGGQAVEDLTRILVETDKPHLRVLAAAMLREVTGRDFGPVSAQMPAAQLQAVADRYRFFATAEQAALRR